MLVFSVQPSLSFLIPVKYACLWKCRFWLLSCFLAAPVHVRKFQCLGWRMFYVSARAIFPSESWLNNKLCFVGLPRNARMLLAMLSLCTPLLFGILKHFLEKKWWRLLANAIFSMKACRLLFFSALCFKKAICYLFVFVFFVSFSLNIMFGPCI